MSAQSLNSGIKPSEKLFSAPLFRENFKRFWPMELVAVLIYFLTGPFIIMMRGTEYHLFESIIEQEHFVFVGLSLLVPVICSSLAFNYLNVPSATNLVHTQPFSRKTLFITSYLSGYAMSIIPAFATLVCLMPLLSKVNSGIAAYNMQYGGFDGNLLESFTVAQLLMWFATVAVVELFVYSISVLASVVSGTTIIQILTAFAFNFLIQALYLSILAYAQQYSFGYRMSDSVEDIIRAMNAWTMFIGVYLDEFITKPMLAIALLTYATVAIAIAAGCYFVYKIRPLERTGDSYVFTPVQWVIGLLISFFQATIVGLAMLDSYGYMGFIIGGAIGFVISQMIVRKTVRIADMQTAKAALVFILVMIVIIAAFSLDVFGITRYTPSASQVDNVRLDNYILSSGYSRNLKFTDEEDIQKMINFHKEIIADKEYIIEYISGIEYRYDTTTVTIEYTLKGGRTVSRRYIIPTKILADSKDVEYLYEKNKPTASDIVDGRNYSDIEVYVSDFAGGEYLSNADKRFLLEAVAKDYCNLSYRDMINNYGNESELGSYVTSIHLSYQYKNSAFKKTSDYQEFFEIIPGYSSCNMDAEAFIGATGYYYYDVRSKGSPELTKWLYDMISDGKLVSENWDK